MKVAVTIKETFRQVGPNEFDRVNPYVEGIGALLHRRPNAKVRKTRTVTEVFNGLQIPLLLVYYDE